jgi:hypothetical protein
VTCEKRIKPRFYWLLLWFPAALWLPVAVYAQDLRASVQAELDARGLGADGLRIISNVLAHDGRTPPRAPAIVGEILADPLAGADAGAIFARSVPPEVEALAALPGPTGVGFDAALERYIEQLAEAQAELMAAVAPFDEDTLLAQLAEGVPVQHLLAMHRAVDLERLARARALFLVSTARFVGEIGSARIPAPQRFESAVGTVVIGGPGADRHASGAAIIIDPGGDDVYERAPVKGGAISVVIDLAGNDRYEGRDIAVHALSAIFDLAGNDVYQAGTAVAMAGVAVVVDAAGDDQYESGVFGQSAALFGWTALIDYAGDDRYRVKAFGQAYAGPGGVALLWDRAGNDVYVGAGLPDAFDRGGGVGFTQGASWGWRGELGGGVGILRDDAGNDRYEGQMFAQGAAYYYALGVLWDGGGNDEYVAVRYAQGNGAHQAAGLLLDASGDDRYWLHGGVGQGMGLDLAVGILVDRLGDDRYHADFVAQGSGTANGFGLLDDRAGDNAWEMGADARSWGFAQWLRGLPTIGVLLHDRSHARFTRTSPVTATYSGQYEIEPRPDCNSDPDAVRAIIADPARHLGDGKLPCAVAAATGEALANIWTAFDTALGLPNAPFLQSIAYALKERAGPDALMQKLGALLKAHPRCEARALWAANWASAGEARATLDSPCWQLQAAALGRLQALGITPPPSASRPEFLGGN